MDNILIIENNWLIQPKNAYKINGKWVVEPIEASKLDLTKKVFYIKGEFQDSPVEAYSNSYETIQVLSEESQSQGFTLIEQGCIASLDRLSELYYRVNSLEVITPQETYLTIKDEI